MKYKDYYKIPGVDAGGPALALKLLERIHSPEARLRALDVQLPRRYSQMAAAPAAA